jgi:hypothetical protein
MVFKNLFYASVLATSYILAADKQGGIKLQIDQEGWLSNKFGVMSAAQIANTYAGKQVIFCRPDGFCYQGKINSVEEDDNSYKIYGDLSNVDDAYFGFVLSKSGVFVGAVVEKKDNKTYVLEFSFEHKGFVLLRTLKYDKVEI